MVGLSRDHTLALLREWDAGGGMLLDPGAGTVRLRAGAPTGGERERMSHLRRVPGWICGGDGGADEVAGGTRESGAGCLALLSLFGGTGLARLATDEMLGALEGRIQLVASGFAELDDALASAVERLWDEAHKVLGVPPHRRLAADSWICAGGFGYSSAPLG